VDDMNKMDDSMETEQSPGGISRRNMIKASVVAGALVWSAPLLLSGTASAQDENCPCMGTLVRLNMQSASLASANCGNVSCLAARDPDLGVACGDREADVVCAIQADNLITFGPGTSFNDGLATLNLDPMLSIVSVSVKQQGAGGGTCYFTDCGPANLSTTQGAPPLNTLTSGATVPVPNRIWVTNAGQTINIALPGSQNNIIEINLLLCVSQAVTGMC
jgi:hypothetical protein